MQPDLQPQSVEAPEWAVRELSATHSCGHHALVYRDEAIPVHETGFSLVQTAQVQDRLSGGVNLLGTCVHFARHSLGGKMRGLHIV